jgi:hypothetical protein
MMAALTLFIALQLLKGGLGVGQTFIFLQDNGYQSFSATLNTIC